MDPHPEYVNDLREHVQHALDHTAGLDPALWGPSSLPYTVLPPATIWSPEEKHQFFHALSRHSRLRPDLIAQEIGGSKSVVEVCVYLDALKRAVESLSEDPEPPHFQIAIEVPARIVRFEDRQSRILRKLEANEDLWLDSDEEEGSSSSSASEDEDPTIDGPPPRKKRRIERKERSRSSTPSSRLSGGAPGHQKHDATEEASEKAADDTDEDVLNKQNVVRLARFYFHNIRSHKGKLQRLGFTEQSITEDIFIELKEALMLWLQGFIRSLVLLLESDRTLIEDDTRNVMARDIKYLVARRRQPPNKKQFFSDLPRRLDLPSLLDHAGAPEADEISEDDRSSSTSSSDYEGDDSPLPDSAHIWHPAVIESIERLSGCRSPSEIEATDEEVDREQTSESETEEPLDDVNEQLLQNAALNGREVYDLQRRYFGTSPESAPSELGAAKPNSARFSAEQTAILEEAFGATPFPNTYNPIATLCGLSRNQVKEWFKYQRRKRGIQCHEIERPTRDPPPWDQGSDDDTYKGSARIMKSTSVAGNTSMIDNLLPIELMGKIFEQLDQKTCGAAAVVCRRWSNAALDELWRSLPSLLPLLRLLGPTEDTSVGKDLRPDVIVAEGTWEIFKGYAKRVRVLAQDDASEAYVSTGLVLRIVSAHLGQTVLPNLREANWSLNNDDTTYQVAVFSSPLLERISLQIANDAVDVRMVQRMLVSMSSFPLPNLRVILVTTEYTRGTDAELNEALSTFIKHRTTLSELRLQAVQVTPSGGLLEAACGFPQLRVFEGDLAGYNDISFRSAIDELASACPLLEAVSLSRGGLSVGDSGEPVTFEDVEPLLRCRHLEDVRVWGDTLEPFEEEDIRRISQAWPRLTTLLIGSRAEPAEDPGAPIRRLMEYAYYLPNLRRFACRFDCVEQIPRADRVTARFKNLRILGLEESNIPSTRLTCVAEFLSMVCGPGVKFASSVNSWFSDRGFTDRDGWAEPDEWNEVEAIIRAIHRAQVAYSRLTSELTVA